MNIDIGNNYALSVEQDAEKGVSITLTKDGEFVQDLVLVERVKGAILTDAVAVYVWGNENDEDFTHRITIPFFKEDARNEDGGSHRESRQTW